MIKDKGKLENNEISKNPMQSLQLDDVSCWKVVYYSAATLNFKSPGREECPHLEWLNEATEANPSFSPTRFP